MRKIVIIGDSGHAKVIRDIVDVSDEMEVIAMLDDKYSEAFVDKGLLKGPTADLPSLIEMDPHLGVVIGIGSNQVRKNIVVKLDFALTNYVSLIHPTAVVSPNARILEGTVVMPGAIINADAQIGKHAIVNSGSVVEHDCVVGDYAHVSPLAVLTGGVCIGEGTHVGAGASIIPVKKVGTWSTIGAGAVVVSDIDDNVTVVGAPARVVKEEGV